MVSNKAHNHINTDHQMLLYEITIDFVFGNARLDRFRKIIDSGDVRIEFLLLPSLRIDDRFRLLRLKRGIRLFQIFGNSWR